MYEPPEEFASNFAVAGWDASRCAPLHASIPAGHPASAVLSRYDGLHVRPNSDAGAQCATSDISFKRFVADDSVAQWAARLRVQLIGIAEIAEAYGRLWVSNDERYFTTNDVDDTFAYVATGFQTAVRNLLSGVRVQPLLPPGAATATVYGRSLSATDPGIYDWEAALSDNR